VDNVRVVNMRSIPDIRDAGDPVEVANATTSQGADEITFCVWRQHLTTEHTTVSLAVEADLQPSLIPITVGRGIRTRAPIFVRMLKR